jgi:carboxyl-terminal processing protease
MKAWALDELMDDIPANFKTFASPKQKKHIDSALIILQRKAKSSLKRRVDNILQNPYGIVKYVGNMYCETIASCYDPHTEFFPPDEKENFESELGKQPFQFGFKIKADKNGGVLIDNLQPGSPAFKCGKLNKGDKFMSMQWEGGQSIDVSDMTTHEFGELVDEVNHKKTLFTVKKADGSNVQVTLEKELVKGDDEDRVKSFILKGNNNIGYIYLPAFYEDWESSNEGLNGCANDVGREILKLKKENINGLILDVRYNGGGSVSEATELAGIFIDAGPVAQEKSRDTKVSTIKDMDRGTIYDGPLVILVNGYSASASELLAGTLQDYNRAVIIGAPTYGKATMQVVLPMDTTVTPENFSQKETENYLKVTTSKLYRVTGATAQFKGVQPDIVLPDVLDAYITKEADEPYAIKPTTIAANKYFIPYTPLPIKTLIQGVQTEVDTNKYFNTIKPIIANAKQKKAASDVSLNINDALKEADQAGKNDDSTNLSGEESKKFTVQSNQYEKDMIQADSDQKALSDEFKHQIAADAFVKIAYDVLAKLKSQ